MQDYVIVTDYKKVSPDDFYLSDKWLNAACCSDITPQQLRDMAKAGELFEAFIVSATAYCIYDTMDSQMVYVDGDMNELIYCESAVISPGHQYCEVYET